MSNDAPVVGVDLGATNSMFGVVDTDNTILCHHHATTRADLGADVVAERIVEGVHETCRQAGLDPDRDVGGVGVAVAGAVDIATGVVLIADNMGWRDYPLRDVLDQALNRHVVVVNDVNSAVWGEFCAGAGREAKDLLGVWVGTGIGGGLVIGGQLHHGAFATAGELGHTISVPDGPAHERTVEDLCSRSGMRGSLERRLAQHPESVLHELTTDGRPIGTEVLVKAYHRDDQLTHQMVNRSAEMLGIAIANSVTLLAIDTVVVGGGITEAMGEPYLDQVRASFDREVFPDRCRDCRIVMTQLQSEAGLLGAALLARQALD
jgi:glucokinase